MNFTACPPRHGGGRGPAQRQRLLLLLGQGVVKHPRAIGGYEIVAYFTSAPAPASLTPLMGSLIKKRRKRMRKKKHKKMLKATRWQRRAGR